jgi:hypothetical protein
MSGGGDVLKWAATWDEAEARWIGMVGLPHGAVKP